MGQGKKQKYGRLTKAVLLGLALGTAGAVLTAPLPRTAEAATSTAAYYFNYDDKPFARVFVFTEGAWGTDMLREDYPGELDSMERGLEYWYRVLGSPRGVTYNEKGKITGGVPDIYAIFTDRAALNATASSPASDGLTELAKYFVQEQYSGSATAARITTWAGNENTQFSYVRYQNLPTQSYNAPYDSVIIHEMLHALGVLSTGGQEGELRGTAKAEIQPEWLTRFDYGLYDYTGKAMKDCRYIQIAEKKPAEPERDVFYVLKGRNSGVYYTGENVKRVLTLNGETAKIAWADGADLETVEGIPINGTEPVSATDTTQWLELSHFELQNSLQSHQSFRNYGVPMELELAFLQDLGFEIDPGKFYGKSIYNSGTAGSPFKYINTTGYDQSTQAGVGLHVYGSYVDVQQNAAINASGYGALGIRVDGADNVVTVNSPVAANGDQARGINISYGKNHQLNINNSVQATGADGIALGFDFGACSMLGLAKRIYRGSYISFAPYYEGISLALPAAVNGPLVQHANINGSLEGKKAAIYISPNALVKNINLLQGAELKGDIISYWSNTALHQLPEVEGAKEDVFTTDGKGEKVIRLPEGEDGMTALNFGVTANSAAADSTFNMTYNGNITDSYDTLNMNVKGGTLNYGGSATVNKVTVDAGAGLYGGTYKVADGFSNHGTIGAANTAAGLQDMNINGSLTLAEGSGIRLTANGDQVGKIWAESVTNSGSVKLSVDAQPQYNTGSYRQLSTTLVTQGAEKAPVALAFSNSEGDKLYESGMLSGVYHTADAGSVDFQVENNMGQLDSAQSQSLQAMACMNEIAGNREQLTPLLNLPAEQARTALQEMAGEMNAQAAAVPQQSTVTGSLITGRLAAVNHAQMNLAFPLGGSNLVDTAETEKPAPMLTKEVPAEPDNSLWAKMDKGWGRIGGSYLHSYTMAVGWDKQYNDCNRFGTMFGFTSNGFNGNGAQDSLRDYRLGFYNGYHHKAHDLVTYVDFGLQTHQADRAMPTVGRRTHAEYTGHMAELGFEYKYDLQADKGGAFHVSPYVNSQLSRYWQNGYAEQGAGIFDQQVRSFQNDYAASELGVEVSRFTPRGSWTGRLGYRHVWTGNNPRLTFSYAGDTAHSWTNASHQDQNFLTASLSGSQYIGGSWSLEEEAHLLQGRHDHNYGLSLTFKYQW